MGLTKTKGLSLNPDLGTHIKGGTPLTLPNHLSLGKMGVVGSTIEVFVHMVDIADLNTDALFVDLTATLLVLVTRRLEETIIGGNQTMANPHHLPGQINLTRHTKRKILNKFLL